MSSKKIIRFLVYAIVIMSVLFIYEKWPKVFNNNPAISIIIGALLPAFIDFVLNDCIFNKKSSQKIYKDAVSINKFLENFIEKGSSICIFSNRLNWLRSEDARNVYIMIKSKLQEKCKVEIIVADGQKIYNEDELITLGLKIYRTTLLQRHAVRFTLINADRIGAAELAMATGTIPNHVIKVYNENDDRQLIELAKELTNIATKKRISRRK